MIRGLLLVVALAACTGSPPMNGLPDPDTARARHAEGNGSNVAVATHDLSVAPEIVAGLVVEAATGLPRWHHEGTRGAVIWLTRRTRIFRFVDDVQVLVEPAPGGARLLLRSASRVGKGDLGQNGRNLQELLAALDAKVGASTP